MVKQVNPGPGAKAAVNGLLLLNKPAGMTSNQALQKVKRLLGARKAGHTGSLDPAATGMLPLCFGEGTKVCAYLLDADKTYRVTARLGEATDTGDADGDVIESAAIPSMTPDQWRKILDGFLGNSQQIPPMYSALKKDGRRLYELARKGQVVDRAPRDIRVDSIDMLEASGKRLVLRVKCSKGTYIRTLVEDIARAAGTVAHTASLHRDTVGHFRSEDMLDLNGMQALAERGPESLRERLLPVDSALATWQEVSIDGAEALEFANGQPVPTGYRQGERGAQPVRVYAPGSRFIGVGELSADGALAPRRIFRISPAEDR